MIFKTVNRQYGYFFCDYTETYKHAICLKMDVLLLKMFINITGKFYVNSGLVDILPYILPYKVFGKTFYNYIWYFEFQEQKQF